MALLSIADFRTLSLNANKRVLKADEYETLVALADASRQTQAQLDELIAAARKAGVEAREQGYQQGIRDAKAAYAEMLADTEARAANYLQRADARILDLVLAIVRKIGVGLGHEQVVADLAANTLRELRNEKRLLVRVHPDNRAQALERVNALRDELRVVDFLDVIADPDLGEFDCVIESDIGVVKAGLDVQLRAIQAALSRAAAQPEPNLQERNIHG